METLSIEDQYGFQINVYNLQAIYFGFSEQDSNQCNNYKDDFYLFQTVPDLNTTSIWNEPLVGIKHQNTTGHDLPWLSMSLQVFNDSSAATSSKGMFVDITWSNNKQKPPTENLYDGDAVLSDFVTINQDPDN
jgi:hypothetical protein